MSVFENYGAEASQLELEIERKGIILGIDWSDAAVVDTLAREALDFKPGAHPFDATDPKRRVRQELYFLANLMLKVMAESAEEKVLSHGGAAWKAFGGALWRAWRERSGSA